MFQASSNGRDDFFISVTGSKERPVDEELAATALAIVSTLPELIDEPVTVKLTKLDNEYDLVIGLGDMYFKFITENEKLYRITPTEKTEIRDETKNIVRGALKCALRTYKWRKLLTWMENAGLEPFKQEDER